VPFAKHKLARGTSSHFDDAAYYTHAYRTRTEDIDYYLGIAVDHGGSVLEYGCGNGRIALPLAHAGLRVTGVDCSAPMLADFRARLKKTPPHVRARIALRRGDMRTVALGQRFDLVLCTFNTFLHLYERRDVERFLARVRAHLARGGRFVLDVSVPVAEELARDPQRLYRWPRFRHPGSGEMVRYGERFDYDPLSQVLMIDMQWTSEATRRRWHTPLAHRQYYPREMEALLHYNGFEIVEQHGDYRHKAPARDVDEIIYHCRVRRR
jgi:SAM-dependent methyltransferase